MLLIVLRVGQEHITLLSNWLFRWRLLSASLTRLVKPHAPCRLSLKSTTCFQTFAFVFRHLDFDCATQWLLCSREYSTLSTDVIIEQCLGLRYATSLDTGSLSYHHPYVHVVSFGSVEGSLGGWKSTTPLLRPEIFGDRAG